MTHISFLKVLSVIAVTMLLMVSSVTMVHADTNYNEGVVDTPASNGAGGAGDATTPGVPNTGPAVDNTMWFVLAVVAIGLIGAAAYYMTAPRREIDMP